MAGAEAGQEPRQSSDDSGAELEKRTPEGRKRPRPEGLGLLTPASALAVDRAVQGLRADLEAGPGVGPPASVRAWVDPW
jgi:hypothetical protein